MFTWDPRALRYRGPGGRFIPRTQVVGALNATLDNTRKRISAVALQLRDGSITLSRWQAETRSLVKSLHLYSVASARGGWDQVSPGDYARLGPRLRTQYKYLDNFAKQVANGEVALDGRFLQRADLYGQAGRGTYWQVNSRVHGEAGYKEERNILNPAEHCDGCLAEAARGWVPIGDLVPIGDRDCKANDRCEIEYR